LAATVYNASQKKKYETVMTAVVNATDRDRIIVRGTNKKIILKSPIVISPETFAGRKLVVSCG